MNIAYVRVSTVEQNEQRQIDALEQHNIDKWYIEKASAKDTNRPKLLEMLEFVRAGDTIYISDFSRLARNTRDLMDITEQLKENKVSLISLKENLDTTTPTGELLLTMIGAINDFERKILKERQTEGIAIAQRNGVYKGREKIKINNKQFEELYQDVQKGYMTKTDMAKRLDISRATLYRRIEEYEEELIRRLKEKEIKGQIRITGKENSLKYEQ